MISYEKIFENNAEWIAKKKATDAQFFEKLAEDRNPDYLYIGCSDSRVQDRRTDCTWMGDGYQVRQID